jgi:hypothetical protein
MEIKADIIDYMGKLDDGIVVSIGVLLDDNYYNGILFYSDSDILISMNDDFEIKIGTPVELWDNYKTLLDVIFSKLEKPNDIIDQLKIVDFSKYLNRKVEKVNTTIEINPNEIIIATQSNLI